MKLCVLDQNTVTKGDVDLRVLEAFGETRYFDALPHEQLAAAIGDAEAVLINKAQLDRAVLEQCPKLRYIGLFATGYNNVDLVCAKERGITVANVPGYSTDSVVQQVFALLLQLSSSTGRYADWVGSGEWIKSKTFSSFPFPIFELSGKTMGVVGFGNIGKKTAKVAEALGMRVIVHTRTIPENEPYSFVGCDALFAEADVISLHCPLTSETENMVNAERIGKMKRGAILINTARGALVDEEALRAALCEGRIFGAGLDVLRNEPMRQDCPLYGVRNCIITPHVAWASIEARHRVVKLAAENLRAYLDGKPVNVVN